MNWIYYHEGETSYIVCCETGAHFQLGDTDNKIHHTHGRQGLANTFENHEEAQAGFDALRAQLCKGQLFPVEMQK